MNIFNIFKSTKSKRKYTKRTYKESDCIVTYDPILLFRMNLPGEYISYQEI